MTRISYKTAKTAMYSHGWNKGRPKHVGWQIRGHTCVKVRLFPASNTALAMDFLRRMQIEGMTKADARPAAGLLKLEPWCHRTTYDTPPILIANGVRLLRRCVPRISAVQFANDCVGSQRFLHLCNAGER